MGPLGDVVVWLPFLEALEDDLILSGDLHKLTLACFAVQTLLELKVGRTWNGT